MFHAANLTMRDTRPLSDSQMAQLPADWLVVFGRRWVSRSLVQSDAVQRLLANTFGGERVRVFSGTLTVMEGEMSGEKERGMGWRWSEFVT